MLQQYLPFTVLKQAYICGNNAAKIGRVATVLTVYGIETVGGPSGVYLYFWRVATVLTVYGIETDLRLSLGITVGSF